MSEKIDINELSNLAKFRGAVIRLNENLETLKVELAAILHDNESLRRENAVLRRLLDE